MIDYFVNYQNYLPIIYIIDNNLSFLLCINIFLNDVNNLFGNLEA